ncbi:hypothetical protein [Streptomyces sp. NPDC057702]|uniref:hypothetical protein n=1 Tax=Streptomyces sp. NPDC057702 TaxID=3346221 RepID=UPI0036B4BDEE
MSYTAAEAAALAADLADQAHAHQALGDRLSARGDSGGAARWHVSAAEARRYADAATLGGAHFTAVVHGRAR